MIEYIKNNRLKVKVRVNSYENKILDYDKERDMLNVSIKAPAVKNKANLELIKFLSKLTKKRVNIIRGLNSKTKVVEFV